MHNTSLVPRVVHGPGNEASTTHDNYKDSLNQMVQTERQPSQVDHLSVHIVKLKKILYKNDRHLQAQHPGHPYLNQNKLVVLIMKWLPWLQTN